MESAADRKGYPTNAGDYKLLEECGHGVSATVHRSLCVPLNEIVAIKVLDLEKCSSNLDEIRREAQTMSLINHTNVVRAHCSFVVDQNLWVVMPFLSGGSCLHVMKSAFPEGFEEVVIATILKETLKALDYLHRHGHIHRDVKAGNILIDANGAVKLADFGVSACMFETGDRQKSRQTFVGTPCWMAPEVMEQIHGYDFKADIWSFGITSLELAHGHAPFSKFPPMKVLLMTLQHAPPSLDLDRDKRFSKSFKEMIASCLVKDPTKRPSADKLLKHPFFRQSRSADYLVKHVMHGLPPLGERVRAVQAKDRAMLAAKKVPFEKEEEVSQMEYKMGVSSWNFSVDDLKTQASLIKDDEEDDNSETPSSDEGSVASAGGGSGGGAAMRGASRTSMSDLESDASSAIQIAAASSSPRAVPGQGSASLSTSHSFGPFSMSRPSSVSPTWDGDREGAQHGGKGDFASSDREYRERSEGGAGGGMYGSPRVRPSGAASSQLPQTQKAPAALQQGGQKVPASGYVFSPRADYVSSVAGPPVLGRKDSTKHISSRFEADSNGVVPSQRGEKGSMERESVSSPQPHSPQSMPAKAMLQKSASQVLDRDIGGDRAERSSAYRHSFGSFSGSMPERERERPSSANGNYAPAVREETKDTKQVVLKGRFHVSKEDHFEKTNPAPKRLPNNQNPSSLPRSGSVGDWSSSQASDRRHSQSFSLTTPISMSVSPPTMTPSATPALGTGTVVPVVNVLPQLQDLMYRVVSQQDLLLNLMNCLASNEPATWRGKVMNRDPEQLEVPTDRERDLLKQVAELQTKLALANDQLETCKIKNVQLERKLNAMCNEEEEKRIQAENRERDRTYMD